MRQTKARGPELLRVRDALPRLRVGGTARSQSTLLDGLYGYWQLDEATGTRYDASGRGNHLTDNATVTQAVGKRGNAAQFTRANSEYLSIADNADLRGADVGLTLAAWVYLDASNVLMEFMNKWTHATNEREYVLFVDSPTPRFNFLVSSDGVGLTEAVASSFGNVSTATWYFVVAWHDPVADTLSIQVNNGVVDSVAHTGGIFAGTGEFALGIRSTAHTNALDGRLDGVGVWRRVLTVAERTQLYNSKVGLVYPFN